MNIRVTKNSKREVDQLIRGFQKVEEFLDWEF